VAASMGALIAGVTLASCGQPAAANRPPLIVRVFLTQALADAGQLHGLVIAKWTITRSALFAPWFATGPSGALEASIVCPNHCYVAEVADRAAAKGKAPGVLELFFDEPFNGNQYQVGTRPVSGWKSLSGLGRVEQSEVRLLPSPIRGQEPDFVYLTIQQVQVMAKRLDISTTVVWVLRRNLPVYTVVQQVPRPGTTRSRRLTLTVAG